MEIQLWWVGKTSFGFLRDGVSEYQKRLSHFCRFTIREYPDVKPVGDSSVLSKLEADQWIKQLKSDDLLILCDENGQELNTRMFAGFIETQLQSRAKRLIFVIGGAYGFSKEIKSVSHSIISFSKMTFSHQMFRLIFMEQLYRAFTIVKSIPYHHD
ncbi:MAG: 23S rRNA (pseudouridine(1915)-N(3))-methyltransferase RlmH [Saprospiraceae bacterium]|nr:23S rRNA (pseudouridine(1915)-N(3))-methyltransferase RlmH [Saprospiraceae bacterium]